MDMHKHMALDVVSCSYVCTPFQKRERKSERESDKAGNVLSLLVSLLYCVTRRYSIYSPILTLRVVFLMTCTF